MSQTRLSDAKLNQLCSALTKDADAMQVVLGDPEVIEDLLERHADLGNLEPAEADAKLGYAGDLISRFLATRHLPEDERLRPSRLPEITDVVGFYRQANDNLLIMSSPDADLTAEARQKMLDDTIKVIWLCWTSGIWQSVGKQLGLEDGTTNKVLALYGKDGLKSGDDLVTAVKSLLTIKPNPNMQLYMVDMLVDRSEARWCQTILGRDLRSLTLPEERVQTAGSLTPQKRVMHYEIKVDCGTLCLSDEFRMPGYEVWKDLNPTTTGGLNTQMGRNLAVSEGLRRAGAFFISTENHAFRTLAAYGKLIAAKSFEMDETALADIARAHGVPEEDVELWLEDGSAFELAVSRNMRSRHPSVMEAIRDHLPQRNMTSTVWGIYGIGRELLIELATEGVQFVIDNPKSDARGASDVRNQIKLLGPNARLIAETQFSAMVEEGYVDLHEMEPGSWHFYKFNAYSEDYSDFTEAMTAAMPDMPPATDMAFVFSRDALDVPEKWRVDMETPVQRLAAAVGEPSPETQFSL